MIIMLIISDSSFEIKDIVRHRIGLVYHITLCLQLFNNIICTKLLCLRLCLIIFFYERHRSFRCNDGINLL